MCYWFLCVPFTHAFARPEKSSTKEEEITCLWRAFIICSNFVGYITLLGIVAFLQFCLLTTLFLSGGHFRYKAGWFLNAFLSATIIIVIPTLISFVLWLKRKEISAPKQEVEVEKMSSNHASQVNSIRVTPKYSVAAYDGDLNYSVNGGLEPENETDDQQSKTKIEELIVEVKEFDGFEENEAGSSFCHQCCLMRLLPFYIIVILCSEIALIFINPFDSLFPIGIASHEIVVPLEGEFVRSKHCANCPEDCPGVDVDVAVRKAREFFKHSEIDFSVVRIAYGGLPGHFGSAGAAMALDRAVYLSFDDCPSTATMVHEFTHVWQMQSGWWFENGVSKFLRYKKEEKECGPCMYSYGYVEGLRKAAEDPEATITSSFFVEEQASIVEDYYMCIHEELCGSEKQQLLMRFAADVLYDNTLSQKSCEVEDVILTWVDSKDCPSEILENSKAMVEYVHGLPRSAKEIESQNTDGVFGDRNKFSGCSSTYLNLQLQQGINSGYCECDPSDDECSFFLLNPEIDRSSNCGIYDIIQWSCPN